MDKQQAIVRVTSPTTQNITLSDSLFFDKYMVRWVQVVGANYPTELQYYINIRGNNAIEIGNSTATNLDNQQEYNIIVPLTAATAVYTFDVPAVVVDRSKRAKTVMKINNAPQFTVRVNSNVGEPTFTEVTVCLESVF